MFKRLSVDNYKSLTNFELPLKGLTLLLGPNGIGKSSVLDIVFALQQLLGGLAKVTDVRIFPTRTLTRWQPGNVQKFSVEVELGGNPAEDLEEDSFDYRIEVEHERSTQRARIVLEELLGNGRPLFSCKKGEVRLYRDDYSEGPSYHADWSESALARVAPRGDNRRLARFLEFMRKVIVCSPYPASFKAESATEDPLLQRNAQNFAGWYRHLLQERQDLVPDFTQAVQDVIDGFKGIRLEKVGLDTRALMLIFEERSRRYELRLDEISDGQRALIALYALIHLTAGQGYTIFLDEPDNYVALPEIQPWLIELADNCGEAVSQAVLCSHHPELIDYLGGDSGIFLTRESSGATKTVGVEDMTVESRLKLSEVVARGWKR